VLLLQAQHRSSAAASHTASATLGGGDDDDGDGGAKITADDLAGFAEQLELLAAEPVFSGIAFEHTINQIHDQARS
jgi:hypothetical protein